MTDGLFAGLPGLWSILEMSLAMVANLAGWFEDKLNREKRSVSSRTLRGALVVSVLLLGAWLAGALLAGLARELPGVRQSKTRRDGRFCTSSSAKKLVRIGGYALRSFA